jgi:hypothetical protein
LEENAIGLVEYRFLEADIGVSKPARVDMSVFSYSNDGIKHSQQISDDSDCKWLRY